MKQRVVFSALFCAVIGPIVATFLLAAIDAVLNDKWNDLIRFGVSPLVWLLAVSVAGPFGLLVGSVGGYTIERRAHQLTYRRLMLESLLFGEMLGALFSVYLPQKRQHA